MILCTEKHKRLFLFPLMLVDKVLDVLLIFMRIAEKVNVCQEMYDTHIKWFNTTRRHNGQIF